MIRGERRKTVCFAVNVLGWVEVALTEGWTCPKSAAASWPAPLKMGLYRQMIGRVLRPATRKPDAIVVGIPVRYWRPGRRPVTWTLDPDRHAERNPKPRYEQDRHRLLECSQCGAIHGGQPCSHCGFLPPKSPRAVSLRAICPGQAGKATAVIHDHAAWHAMLTAIALERGYKTGWAAVNYKEKFGHWPTGRNVTPIEPTPEVRSWVRSKMIAFANRRAAA
jgi:hypothetical protein